MMNVSAKSRRPLMELRDISFRYAAASRDALTGVDLTIAAGEKIAVLGPSQSGKTTLLLALTHRLSELRPGEFKGVVNQQPEMAALPQAQRVGMVLQDAEAMFCNLRVWEEIAFGLEGVLDNEEAILKRVSEMLALVGLTGYENHFVYELSGGEMQKLAIACAVAPRPHLLLLDEITESLDPKSRGRMSDALDKLARQGTAVVFAANEWTPIVSDYDRVLVLVDGQIRAFGSPKTVLKEQGTSFEEWGILPPESFEIGLALFNRGFWTEMPLDEKELLERLFCPQHVGSQSRTASTDRPSTTVRESRNILRVDRLSFSYNGQKPVIHDVSLALAEGELVAFVGRNGSGKTTLAKLIAGLLKPSRGSIAIASSRQAKKGTMSVGYVFQNPTHQFLQASVFDEAAFGIRLAGVTESDVEQRVALALREIGIPEEIWQQSPFALSEAHQRLLALLSISILQPSLLIVDEPTQGQDAHSRRALVATLKRIKKQGQTIVVISHDLRFIEHIADRVYALSQGRIVYEGELADLLQQSQLMDIVGLEPTALARVVSLAANRGVSIPRFQTAVEPGGLVN